MNIFKKLGWFFKQERKRYIIGITFLALTSLANLIPPRVLGLMADQLDQGHISWGAIWDVDSSCFGCRLRFIYFALLLA